MKGGRDEEGEENTKTRKQESVTDSRREEGQALRVTSSKNPSIITELL